MITVLRLGHRPGRDRRVTTHVALVARAFGADRIVVAASDAALERTVRSVVGKFGGTFEIETGVSWRDVLRGWPGTIVHLTMYGEAIDAAVPQIPRGDLLVVVGAEKVPRAVFEHAHRNVAVGHQPHSEVAALAVFLDRWLQGGGLRREFSGPVRVVPSARGKRVVDARGARV